MEAIRNFFIGYWGYCQWWLVGIGLLYLIILVPFRRPGKAAGVLLVGIYVTMTAYFLTVRGDMGFDEDLSLGVVIAFGLALGAILYYFFIIRPE